MKNSIKVERARISMTQADLAERTKVSRQTINAIELGKYIPSATLAIRIAKVFEVKVEDIFEIEDHD